MDEPVCHNTEKDLIRLAFKVAPNEIGITSPKTKQIEAITLLFTHYCHKHFFVTSANALIPSYIEQRQQTTAITNWQASSMCTSNPLCSVLYFAHIKYDALPSRQSQPIMSLNKMLLSVFWTLLCAFSACHRKRSGHSRPIISPINNAVQICETVLKCRHVNSSLPSCILSLHVNTLDEMVVKC